MGAARRGGSTAGPSGRAPRCEPARSRLRSGAMLAITESAAEAINALVSRGDMPEGSGARIAADGEGQGLELALVPGPAEDDAVVEGQGATVYLEQTAAQVLGDKVLDIERFVESTGEEQLRFAIVPKDGLDGQSMNGSA